MKKLLILMRHALSCQESTRLVSDSVDRKLSAGERLAISMHKVMCWPCRRFVEQIELLHEAFQRRARGDQETLDPESSELSSKARERIAAAITRHQQE